MLMFTAYAYSHAGTSLWLVLLDSHALPLNWNSLVTSVLLLSVEPGPHCHFLLQAGLCPLWPGVNNMHLLTSSLRFLKAVWSVLVWIFFYTFMGPAYDLLGFLNLWIGIFNCLWDSQTFLQIFPSSHSFVLWNCN